MYCNKYDNLIKWFTHVNNITRVILVYVVVRKNTFTYEIVLLIIYS